MTLSCHNAKSMKKFASASSTQPLFQILPIWPPVMAVITPIVE